MAPERVLTLWNNDGINSEDTSILRKKSAELKTPLEKDEKKEIQTLIDSFTCRNDASGLAAPQIGINKRIIIFRNKTDDERKKKMTPDDYDVLINPRITQSRGEKVTAAEGCLSCPDIQIEVSRFPEIKIRALNQKGEKVSKRYLDWTARVVQHEIDHLDGKLIVDYEGNLYYPKEKQSLINKIFK
ncbi:MAG: peptide deformylase [Syntrophaceae bacterium]|jgi:peptide deformylase|nr:peptide deformylase [Syntrophaceae bacterium]HOC58907.1 peptide deformylase [Smithellaceae bacterium]HQM44323.1 peptide deformylase [Smithellaceae bacterium]